MVLLISFSLSSCDSKQNAVYELLAIRTEIKEHYSSYSQADWENAIERYNIICQELNEMQLTEEERLDIDKIKGEIAGYAATVVVQEATDEMQSIADEIKSFVSGFITTFQSPKLKGEE